MSDNLPEVPLGEFVLFHSEDGQTRVECRFESDTLWLSLADKETNRFFQTIQNKLHFACTGMTAAELIASRADASQPDMGLTSYKSDEVRKTDVTVAKNYLHENELKELNRIVNMWLDFAEDQALRRKQAFLQDWDTKLDQFLSFNDREVLQGAERFAEKR